MIENNPKKICTYLKHFAGDLKLTQYCKSTTCVHVSHTQSCLILCDSMDCSPPGSWVHGIPQARILEWEAIPFSRGSSQHRDRTQVSCIAGKFFTTWDTREALPDGLAGKQSTCNAGDPEVSASIPGLGRSPGGGNGNPFLYSCLKNPMDRGAWWATVLRMARVGRDCVAKHMKPTAGGR